MAGWQHELHVLDSRAAPFLKTGRLANPVRLFGHPERLTVERSPRQDCRS